MKKQLVGSLLLLLTAMVWGAGFVAQSEGAQHIGAFTMLWARYLLSGLVLLPVIKICDVRKVSHNRPKGKTERKKLLVSGCICGVLLFVASAFQQIGISYTTTGKSGFITALYIIFVPIIAVLLRRKPSPAVWVAAAAAVVGMYFLCINEGFSVGKGDLLTLACAFSFSFHILYIDRVSPELDGVRLSCIQFFVCSAVAFVLMLVFEKPDITAIRSCMIPILYAGVFSGGVGYTLQIIGQKYVQPSVASLLMSLESVFAAVFGWMILGQKLSGREILGCVIMFAAIIVAQLPVEKLFGNSGKGKDDSPVM